MKSLLAYGLLLTDFTSGTPDFGWYILNDNVMGGRSEGTFELRDELLHFSGDTNTNGGGFSSIRTAAMELDLSGYAGIRVRVKGDGRRYTWRLTTTARWRGREVSYWADFDTVDGEWMTADVSFSSFVPRFRGSRLDGPPLDTSQITGMGLMIYDNRDGPFEVFLDSVHAYSETAPFSLSDFRWQRRVLVISAPSRDDASLALQLDALKKTADEFTDRDMLLVTLLDDAGSAAGDRALVRSDVSATRKALGIGPGVFALRLIGKDGTVKLSNDAPTPVAEIYDLIDGMPMRQREQRLDP